MIRRRVYLVGIALSLLSTGLFLLALWLLDVPWTYATCIGTAILGYVVGRGIAKYYRGRP